MTIMVAITLIRAVRMTTFVWRITMNHWATDSWMWYRLVTDWTNFLLGVIALVLLI